MSKKRWLPHEISGSIVWFTFLQGGEYFVIGVNPVVTLFSRWVNVVLFDNGKVRLCWLQGTAHSPGSLPSDQFSVRTRGPPSGRE